MDFTGAKRSVKKVALFSGDMRMLHATATHTHGCHA